jgi:hypothetical protein
MEEDREGDFHKKGPFGGDPVEFLEQVKGWDGI